MWWWTVAMAAQPMVIQVVDDATGDPIPCATLTTVHAVSVTTDDEGLATFVEPGLFGLDVWFEPSARGYRYAPDWLGLVGEAIRVREGGFARIEMERSGAVANCAPSDHARRLIQAGVPTSPMRFEVLDRATGRGVPLARVRAGDASWITDSAGNVAVLDPALYGQDLDVTVEAWHGYGPSATTAASIAEGGHLVLEVDRTWPAERLYRITGADPYRDTELLGLPAPFPALQGQVVGIDSALSVEVDGELLWLFGDTLRPSYPLGHFDTAAAYVSGDPDAGVELDFVVDSDGFSRGVADLSDDGPVWLSIPTPVDSGGDDVILAVFGVYAGLVVQERGFATLDVAEQRFVPVAPLDLDVEFSHQTPIREGGFVTLREGIRFPDSLEQAIDLDAWQTWSPLVEDVVERHADGTARWAWRDGVEPPDPSSLTEPDQWPGPRDPDASTTVAMHYGDVARNEHLGRFVHVFTRLGGESAWLGELWVSVADTPFGPWSYARRIAAFDDYTLYNPTLLDSFDTDGRQVYVQGTYTDFFARAEESTPRYDYNQLMFRLDLDDPRARLPVPYYRGEGTGAPSTAGHLVTTNVDPVLSFHAYEAPVDGRLAIGRDVAACAGGVWTTSEVQDPLLWAEPEARSGLVPIWDDNGALSVEALPADVVPLGWVWPVRGASHVPAHQHLPPARLLAGPDLCLEDEGVGAAVTLEAFAEGGALSWTIDGAPHPGPKPTVVLPAGDHIALATLLTPSGSTLEDRVLVHVQQATDPETRTTTPTTTPTETPPVSGLTARQARGATDPWGCGCQAASSPRGWFDGMARRRQAPDHAESTDR